MKTSQIILLIALFLLGCVFTGFQCGSTEMTSAKLYIQRSDWVNAEKSLEKEVAKNPANAEAWYHLGFSRYNLKKYDGMLDAFENSLKAGNEFAPKITEVKLAAWAQAFNAGVGTQNKMVNASPDSQAMYGKEAVNSYQLALKINPDSASTYQNLAALYHQMGNYDQEVATWQKARERKNDPQFSNYIINAYIKRADMDRANNNTEGANENINKALAELQEARKADPNNQELLTTMINLYIEAGRAKEAMPYIRESLEKDPGNKVNQNNLGLLLLQTDNLEEATTHFDAALQTDPNYEEALRNGSVAYMRLGQQIKDESQEKDGKGNKTPNKAYVDKFKKAVTYLERLVEVKPDNPDFWDALATAYGNSGMFKEAEKAVKKADSLRKN